MKLSPGAAIGLVILLIATTASGTDVSGNQSGTWTLAESPYDATANITVPPGQSLVIEPGVQVVAAAGVQITVEAQALLRAVGTASQPIIMTAADNVAGWRGLRLESSHDDTMLRHCVIQYAVADGLPWPDVRGGALMVRNCSPLIADNTFRFNLSRNASKNGCGGAICTESSDAVILDNLIHDNEADSGGGIATTEYGTPLVRGNVIRDNVANNAGGGMYLGARSTPLIEGNRILRNSAGGWGGGGINSWTAFVYYGTFATIRNNIITHNSTIAAGGGLYCRYDRARLQNNLIAYNSASHGGGVHALNQGFSAPDVDNCIVWGNTAGTAPQVDLTTSTGSLISITYSCVDGGWPGTGVISTAPFFVDADGADDLPGTIDDDYHLAPGSAGIDAANNAVLAATVTTDADGNPRYVDDAATPDTGAGSAPVIDMGPYEYQGSPWLDLGNALAGTSGLPTLTGAGTLTAGDPVTLTLANALPNGLTVLVAGDTTLDAPFKGGVLVPAPAVLLGAFPVDGAGALLLADSWPNGLPAGSVFYFQHWIADPGAPFGYAASNGLSGEMP